jgi:tyrosine-protein phosphatase SIW14
LSRRSLVALFFVILTGFVVFLVCKNRNVTSVQAGNSRESVNHEAQPLPLTDNSAQVSATLPYFHRLDESYTRGSVPAKGGFETLKRLGVKTVVDLRSIYDHTHDTGVAAERSGLNYYWLPTSVWDPPTDARAKEFVSLVEDSSKGPFYVFCSDGLNRVGEMSAIYRVAKSRWTVDQALKEADDFGFNPYYWSLRNYVYTYARKFHPKALPPQARSLSSTEM